MRVVDGAALPLESGSVDVVVSSSVVEYVSDLRHYATEVRRVLKPGGVFVVTVPDERSAVRVFERGLRLLARFAPRAFETGKLKGYVEYLRLSKNRFDSREWVELFYADTARRADGFLWLEGRVR
ncbi:MAG: methyltransferase domain-containing protein [Deltaproteobacteria bacterium]|nr:methyltransferase domain-containing protein [Deltaproteobacteria bacterium]